MTTESTTTNPALEPQDMTDDELKAAISFHEAEAHKFKCEAAKIWRLRVRMDGGIAIDKRMLAELYARRAARVSALSVAPVVDGISWPALLSVLERLKSKTRNPDAEWYHGWNAAIQCLINDINARSAAAPVDQRPIDMILFCPRCGTQHVDAPEDDISFQHRMEAFGLVAEPQDSFPTRWTNPPHKSHLCHQCGAVWRPADTATNGVARIATRGERDNWTNSIAAPASPAALRDEAETFARQVVGTVFDNTGASHETLKQTMIERIADSVTPPSTLAKAAAEEIGFTDFLPLTPVRVAPGEYEVKTRDGRVLWRMEGAALSDWVCASVNGYDSAVNALSRPSKDAAKACAREISDLIWDEAKKLAQSFVDANIRNYNDHKGVESLERVYDAKRDTAQQIVNQMHNFREARWRKPKDVAAIIERCFSGGEQ